MGSLRSKRCDCVGRRVRLPPPGRPLDALYSRCTVVAHATARAHPPFARGVLLRARCLRGAARATHSARPTKKYIKTKSKKNVAASASRAPAPSGCSRRGSQLQLPLIFAHTVDHARRPRAAATGACARVLWGGVRPYVRAAGAPAGGRGQIPRAVRDISPEPILGPPDTLVPAHPRACRATCARRCARSSTTSAASGDGRVPKRRVRAERTSREVELGCGFMRRSCPAGSIASVAEF